MNENSTKNENLKANFKHINQSVAWENIWEWTMNFLFVILGVCFFFFKFQPQQMEHKMA